MSSVIKLRSTVARGSTKQRSEARKWIEREGIAYIRREFVTANPLDAEPKITVAAVMQYLDDREAPRGYTDCAGDNAARYQLVRGVLEQAAQPVLPTSTYD